MPPATTNPSTNLAWTIPSHASTIHDLTRLPLPIPSPGPSQVLIRMTSVSLNYRDLVIATRSPLYPGTHKANLVPCTDGAGLIHAAGAGSKWAGKEGERVLLHPNEWLSGDARNLEGKFGVGSAEYDGK
jgi:NADPH:quinone reductase-like Zn-dependent oxidoreductase